MGEIHEIRDPATRPYVLWGKKEAPEAMREHWTKFSLDCVWSSSTG